MELPVLRGAERAGTNNGSSGREEREREDKASALVSLSTNLIAKARLRDVTFGSSVAPPDVVVVDRLEPSRLDAVDPALAPDAVPDAQIDRSAFVAESAYHANGCPNVSPELEEGRTGRGDCEGCGPDVPVEGGGERVRRT